MRFQEADIALRGLGYDQTVDVAEALRKSLEPRATRLNPTYIIGVSYMRPFRETTSRVLQAHVEVVPQSHEPPSRLYYISQVLYDIPADYALSTICFFPTSRLGQSDRPGQSDRRE